MSTSNASCMTLVSVVVSLSISSDYNRVLAVPLLAAETSDIPQHRIDAAQKYKKADRGRKSLGMLMRVDHPVRHIKKHRRRVGNNIPGIPAQFPAYVDRKAAKQKNKSDKDGSSLRFNPSCELPVYRSQAQKTQNYAVKNK